MKKVIRLTESDLMRIVKKIINEADLGATNPPTHEMNPLQKSVEVAIYNCYKTNPKITQRSNYIANQIFKAIDGVGTDEEGLYKSLKLSKDMPEFCSVCASYEKLYNEDLYQAFNDGVSEVRGNGEWSKVFRAIPGIKA